MRRSLLCLAVGICATLPGPAPAQPGPKLDPDQPYQARRLNPVTYEVELAAIVTAPYQTRTLRVWMPVPPSDTAQDVTGTEFSTFPVKVKPRIASETRFGNRFAYFEFDHPEGAQIIRHKFNVQVWELRWDIDPAQVMKVKEWPAGFDRYLKGEDRAVVVNDQVRNMAQLWVPQSRGPANDLNAVLFGVNGFMKYDHVIASLQANSEHALKHQRGHCSDYHGLCAAVGRVLGCPTRVAYGINPFPKQSPSHCKLEGYLPPYGWVSFDASDTQRLIDAISKDGSLAAKEKADLIAAANQRLTRGFRDNTWFLQTRGTDYDLVPPASNRVSVVRTIYAEADGVALPDPDPANPKQREFGWMTAHQYKADKVVPYPFKDWKSLLDKKELEKSE